MSVYKKLQDARSKLHNTKLTKSGKNAFAKFNYFELADFMPAVTEIFNEVGLCGIVSFTPDTAYLTIYDVAGDERAFVTFTSPLVMASMDRIQAIQSLGATHTYFRRYLYLMALDLVENDLVDSVEPKTPTKTEEPVKKIVAKEEPKIVQKMSGKEGSWQIKTNEMSEEEWGKCIKDATQTLLCIAEKQEDVNDIFKVNRVIYDRLKSDYKSIYDEIMTQFKTKKEELK
jgi:hypothetical protein